MDSVVNKKLLEKYFEGKATVFEKKLIDDWVSIQENQEVFYLLLGKYETQNIQFLPDVEFAFEKHKLKIEQQSEATIESEHRSNPKFKFSTWLAAAIVIFLVGFGLWTNQDKLLNQIHQTAFGEVKTIQLTDGSTVVLNANSSLKIPRFGFGSHSRVVFLEGEAQFSVKHTIDNQPFIVKTAKKFEVLVLGTEFNIYTRASGAKVVLNSGKIELSYQDGLSKKKVIMKPGDLVSFNKSNKIEKIMPVKTKQFSAWKEHRFVFDETSLEEITHLFEDNFGQKINIENPELLNWTVSGSFTALNADELLEILSEASNLSFRKENETIIIFIKK